MLRVLLDAAGMILGDRACQSVSELPGKPLGRERAMAPSWICLDRNSSSAEARRGRAKRCGWIDGGSLKRARPLC